MATSQDKRYEERLARQRGAGTHKVTNLGFVIQPLGRHLASTSSAPPPPPPPPRSPPPKASTPKPVTPTQELPPRRSSHSVSRNSSPTVDTATLTAWENTRPSSLHEEATTVFSSSGTPQKPESVISATRRFSLRGFSTPATAQSLGNASVPRTDTPISHILTPRASARLIDGKTSVVATATPVARGKRVRQPSPYRSLKTPEAEGIDRVGRGKDGLLRDESVVRVEGEDANEREVGGGEDGEEEEEGEEGEGESEGEEGDDKNVTMDVDDIAMNVKEGLEEEVEEIEDLTVQEVEEESESSVIAVKSHGNWNKRRKVVLQDSELQATPSEQIEEPVSRGRGAGTSELKRKRQMVGEKPTPQILEGEEEEEEEEDENIAGDISELGERQEPDEVPGELEGSQDQPSRPPQRTSKPPPNLHPKVKPKPRRRAQRTAGQGGGEESASTFPVIVHRLGKSHGFILPVGSQRSGVNPIDVINQVSMEIIDKYFFKAQSNSERKAVESFKEELSLRFLELTDALENNIVLTARARQTQKRKAQLMTELLSVKQKREHIAVKMDGVRKKHELATKSGENQQRIFKAFEDISGTLERGEARQPEEGETGIGGLVALIRKVSATVTGGDRDGTGLLATVVRFNNFLERAERVLSERRRL